jgi:hypothetical protein
MDAAADGLDMKDEQFRAIAVMLETEKRGPGKRPRPPVSAANLERRAHPSQEHTPWPGESVRALQASRRLLARTIDMLL